MTAQQLRHGTASAFARRNLAALPLLYVQDGRGVMENRSARAALAAFPAAALLATASCSSTPQDFTVNGTVEVAVQSYDESSRTIPGSSATRARSPFTDPSGKVIAVATADNGNVSRARQLGDETLTAGFTAKVPAGLSFYGISVTGRAVPRCNLPRRR